MLRGNLKKFIIIVSTFVVLLFQTPMAFANATWGSSVDATYDVSVTSNLMRVQDELHDGGINLESGEMTTDKDTADLSFDPYANMGANKLIDLGKIDFNNVTQVPDDERKYSTYTKAVAGHVYIVITHDGKYAKILVKNAFTSKVLIKYAFLNEQSGDDTTSGGEKSYVFEDGGIVIIWNPIQGAASYDLMRSDNGDKYVTLTDFPLTETSFTDRYGIAGHTYFYKYVAYDKNDKLIAESKPIKVLIVSKQADPASDDSLIILRIGDNIASVNGGPKTLDVPPVIVDGRTLVPLRFIAEALKAKVDWDGSEQRISVVLGNDTLLLWLNQSEAKVNGKTVYMDVPPKLINDRTMVPIRFISESLHQEVSFDGHTQTVTIKGKAVNSGGGGQTDNDDQATADLNFFFGDFDMIVPSTVVNGEGKLGVASGSITIYSDGTYLWRSTYEARNIEGTWEKTGDSGYPIVLLNGEGDKEWRVGKSTEDLGGDIIVWDGSIWKIGTRTE